MRGKECVHSLGLVNCFTIYVHELSLYIYIYIHPHTHIFYLLIVPQYDRVKRQKE